MAEYIDLGGKDFAKISAISYVSVEEDHYVLVIDSRPMKFYANNPRIDKAFAILESAKESRARLAVWSEIDQQLEEDFVSFKVLLEQRPGADWAKAYLYMTS